VTPVRLILLLLLVLGSVATAGPVLYYAASRLNEFGLLSPQNLRLADAGKLQLSRLGQVQMLGRDEWENRETVRVLTLRQAEFAFYSKVRFISHIDPRMVPFFSAKTVEAAFQELRRLGITHVSIPEEPLPTLYNSFLEEITNSGRFVRRRDHFGGAVLCELFDQPLPANEAPEKSVSAGNEWTPWSAVTKYAVTEATYAHDGTITSIFNSPSISANAREVRLSSGPGPIDVAPQLAGSQFPLQFQFGHEYLLDADIRGEGLVQVEMHLYIDDTPPKVVPLWQGFLSGRSKRLRAIFMQDAVSLKCIGCTTATGRVVVRLLSRGEIHLGETVIRETGFVGRSSSFERAMAERRGWSLNATQPRSIRWGLVDEDRPVLFARQSGAYPVSLQSLGFSVREGVTAPSLSFQVRGHGRFFVELMCARDERASAQEIPPETDWLARVLLPIESAAPPVRSTIDDVSVQSSAAAYASDEWKKVEVRLRMPDCPPLSRDAVVSRRLPINQPADPGVQRLNVLRLAFVTRREVDFAGTPEELPDVQFRDISLDISPSTDNQEIVKL
jgi:hypothetical protein